MSNRKDQELRWHAYYEEMETFLADAAICKAECCKRDTGTVVSTLRKMPGFKKLPSAFSMLFIQYGELTGENLSQQLKTTSPATTKMQKYCIQAITHNPEQTSPCSSVPMACQSSPSVLFFSKTFITQQFSLLSSTGNHWTKLPGPYFSYSVNMKIQISLKTAAKETFEHFLCAISQ